MSYPAYGRYHVAEAPSASRSLHFHQGGPLKEVDHEPKIGVIDQSDLIAQGIDTSVLIPGALKVDALGSCTANATVSALSNLLSEADFGQFILPAGSGGWKAEADVYSQAKCAEEAAIRFYHESTDQTGQPSEEWPPTDCGSSGPYIVSELQRLKLASGAQIASGAQSIVSLLQTGGILQGTPFFYAWEQPDAHGFVDGDGSVSAIEASIASGVAGGHETFQSAIEKLTILPTGQVDPFNTVIRVRNSWGSSWGDAGSFRMHLSTLVAIGGSSDFRQLVA